MPPDSQRLFFALDPPGPVRERIAHVQAQLDLPAPAVAPANFHITLAFLGQVSPGQVPALTGLAGRLSPLCGELVLDRLGSFPRAGVAWLGCSEIPPALADFQSELAACLKEAGFRFEERAWKPHVTLYRKMRMPFDTIPFEAIAWRVQGFCLMHSAPGEKGPDYRPLAHWNGVKMGD